MGDHADDAMNDAMDNWLSDERDEDDGYHYIVDRQSADRLRQGYKADNLFLLNKKKPGANITLKLSDWIRLQKGLKAFWFKGTLVKFTDNAVCVKQSQFIHWFPLTQILDIT